MRIGTRSSIFHSAMCIAALGFIALVVLVAHPASPSSRITAMKATSGNESAAADTSFERIGAMFWRLAPAKEAQTAAAPTPGQNARKQEMQR
jgi:hypothetical protein